MERAYDVQTTGAALPLGSIPLSTARPAIRAALVALARDDRFDTWLGRPRADAPEQHRLRTRPAPAASGRST